MGQTPDFPIIRGQRGLATIPQLLERGWTPAATRHARATIWQEPMPRVVAPHRGQLDGAARVTASWLWAGSATVLTGMAALNWLGVKVGRFRQVTLVAPATGRAKSLQETTVVRSWRPIDGVTTVGAVPVAPAHRALVDAAAYETHGPDRLEHLAINILQQGLTTPKALELELYTRPKAKVKSIWQGLRAFTQGAWSVPEKELRRIIEGAGGYPRLLTNVTLETLDGELVGCPDGYLKEASTVIQVDSREFHQGIDDRGADRWARTVEGDTAYTAVGLRHLGVTPWTLYRQPRRFLTSLRRVVDIGLEGPPARVRVRPAE